MGSLGHSIFKVARLIAHTYISHQYISGHGQAYSQPKENYLFVVPTHQLDH